MKSKTLFIVVIVLAVCSVAVGLLVYNRMPEMMASHWGADGQVNDYMSRFWGVFMIPLMIPGMAALMYFIPRLDPLKSNVAVFQEGYNLVIAVTAGFLFYVYLLTLVWNLGYRFDLGRLMVPAFAVLSYMMGVLLGKAKRNFFIGVRTPWTLSSDEVWDKTHQRAGILFKAAGVMSLLGLLSTKITAMFLIIPLMAAALYTVVYSYIVFRRVEKNGR